MKSKIVTKFPATSLQSQFPNQSSQSPCSLSLVKAVLVLLIFSGVLLHSHSAGALCDDYSDYIRWETTFQSTFGGVVEDILIVGDYAYLALSSSSGGKLCVVDISDPGNPEQISLITTSDDARGLEYDAPYLFVVCDDGLTIYNATTVTNPVQVGYLAMAGEPEAVSVRWPVCVVVGTNPEFSMLNIATPSNPILMKTTDWPSGGAEDVQVEGNLAFVADWATGLVIVDFTNYPDLDIGSVSLPGGGYGVHLRGSYAWVMGQDAVTVINVSNPNAPTISNSTAMPGLAIDICFATLGVWPPRTYAAVAMLEGTTHIFSSTDAGTLVPVCSAPGPYGVKCIANDTEGSSWSYLFVGSQEQGMYVVNRRNLANPPVAGTINVDAIQVLAAGSTAYLATANDIQTFDVSSAASPQMLGSISIPAAVTDMVMRSPYLYTTLGYSGLNIYDVSSPGNPVRLGSEQNPEYGGKLDICWPYAYVVPSVPFEEPSLRVYDISDPTNPIITGIASGGWEWTDFPARDVAVQGSYAYVTGDDNVLVRVVDISNPADPELVNAVSRWGYGYNVEISNGHAYISKYTGGSKTSLDIFDLSDPLNPLLVSNIVTPAFSREAKVFGDYAFLCSDSGWEGMFILDVSDPANPLPRGIAATQAKDVFVNSSYMFIANYEELLIMPTQCGIVSGTEEMPSVTTNTLAAYPNPFNPRTTIFYELPDAARVNLAVYDLSGRLVRTLMTGQQHSPGQFEVVWSGTNDLGRMVASGVYVCRLEAGDYRASINVTLVK